MSKVDVVVPNMGISMMTGVAFARIYGKGFIRRVELTYTDGSTESAKLTNDEIADGKTNFFQFVSMVQKERSKP